MPMTGAGSRRGRAVVAVMAMLLAACSATLFIKPAGDLSAGVEFRFHDDPEFLERPSSRTLVHLAVQVRTSDTLDTWETTWEIEGKQSLDRVRYGASYRHLKAVVDAKPLEAGRVYRVIAGDRGGWTRPPGGGLMYFRIDADGVARQTGPP